MSSKGADFERLCRKELELWGWTVCRSAGSHGPADLWAIRKEGRYSRRLLFVQVKSGKQTCSPREWNQLVQAAEKVGAVPVLADKAPRVTAPQWWEITGRKSGRRGEPQPRKPMDPAEWAADAV